MSVVESLIEEVPEKIEVRSYQVNLIVGSIQRKLLEWFPVCSERFDNWSDRMKLVLLTIKVKFFILWGKNLRFAYRVLDLDHLPFQTQLQCFILFQSVADCFIIKSWYLLLKLNGDIWRLWHSPIERRFFYLYLVIIVLFLVKQWVNWRRGMTHFQQIPS